MARADKASRASFFLVLLSRIKAINHPITVLNAKVIGATDPSGLDSAALASDSELPSS